MSAAMPRRFVSELANGDAVDELFLVAEKQLRADKQGNQYLSLGLRDRTGVIDARLWNANPALAGTFEAGDYLQVKGKVHLFHGTPQLILSQIKVTGPDGIDPDLFQPRGSQSVAALLGRLRPMLFGLGNPHLRALGEAFLIDEEFMSRFGAAPAGIKTHHAFLSGLLEHVVTMMTVITRIADLYPEVDRDLWLIGAFLHDMGKVRELSYDRGFGYSDEGQLIGHLVIGVEMLNEKILKAQELTGEPFPEELTLRLKHMIVSHHGELEFGSPKLPMTPEAVALYYLDNLDAKIHTFTREIRDDPHREARWTPYFQSMNRRIFKGGGDNGSESDLDAPAD